MSSVTVCDTCPNDPLVPAQFSVRRHDGSPDSYRDLCSTHFGEFIATWFTAGKQVAFTAKPVYTQWPNFK